MEKEPRRITRKTIFQYAAFGLLGLFTGSLLPIKPRRVMGTARCVAARDLLALAIPVGAVAARTTTIHTGNLRMDRNGKNAQGPSRAFMHTAKEKRDVASTHRGGHRPGNLLR
jgi:hypothetical protein